MKLNKEDWKKLDELLTKIGFGGYYDLVDSLKMIIRYLLYKNQKLEEKLSNETDIHVLVNVIFMLIKKANEKHEQEITNLKKEIEEIEDARSFKVNIPESWIIKDDEE